MEAEYISLCEAGQETIWFLSGFTKRYERRLLKDFNIDVKTPIIYEDNQSCLKFSEKERFQIEPSILIPRSISFNIISKRAKSPVCIVQART